jgi:hypothetical protein
VTAIVTQLAGTAATLAVCATLAAGVLDAQSSRPTASLRISGRVVAAASGTPIPYARLRVADASWSIRSDIDGAFSLDVPRGATIRITKAGFAGVERTAASFATNTDVRMVRAAVLSGRITNEYGQPIVGATVTANAQSIRASATATTDDRGEYRIGGLSPDKYRVGVQTAGESSLPDTDRLARFEFAPVPATVGDRAVGVVMFRPTTTTTYFPGTLDPSVAEDIALGEAVERHDIDLQVSLSNASRQPLLITTFAPPIVDNRPPVPNGATIRGVVMDSQSRPLPYAQVTLDGIAFTDRAVDMGLVSASYYRTGLADERGSFEFTGLRPGRYTPRAAKAGYSQPFGRPLAPPVGVSVAGPDEVHVTNVTLIPWGAISGRIRDEFGDPAQGLTVRLLQTRYERGKRRLVAATVAARTTDDFGEFRMFAVPPGEYFVSATVDAGASGPTGYVRTFYPGVLSAGDARSVALELGSEAGGIEFSLFATPTVSVSGTTLDASGKPTTQLRLSLISRSDHNAVVDAHIDTDGTFEFENVPPGAYLLKADAGRTNTFTEGEFVAMPLNVGQAGVTDLRVQAVAGSTITGRFVFDRYVRTSDPPPTAVTVTAIPDDFDGAPDHIASTSANAAGIFQLRGVTGTRRLQVARMPPRYMVSAILVNGRDVTDDVITFGRANQSLDDVQVVLTDRITRVAGTVDDGQKPVAGAHVVVFSTNRSHWYPLSRHHHRQTTGSDGTFVLTGLPTGSYFAAAVTALPTGDDAWQDPAYLEQLSTTATVIPVGDGDNTTNLRLNRP